MSWPPWPAVLAPMLTLREEILEEREKVRRSGRMRLLNSQVNISPATDEFALASVPWVGLLASGRQADDAGHCSSRAV